MSVVTALKSTMKLFFAVLIGMQLNACASGKSAQERMEERQADARPSKDTIWTDRFYMNQPSPRSRDVHSWEFFYKDCELAKRARHPTRSEWECQDR